MRNIFAKKSTKKTKGAESNKRQSPPSAHCARYLKKLPYNDVNTFHSERDRRIPCVHVGGTFLQLWRMYRFDDGRVGALRIRDSHLHRIARHGVAEKTQAKRKRTLSMLLIGFF